ncbi:STAS domain-containing protein [Sphaerisporangium fuscum]|uniref:STAS domain-containing protein n=1 Tax=Sphaerisporangium fuscum TaxID=2835868 RepID=UPI001BDD6C19|nr:STAS domain-containing protein [Sphaerisporangium fuscum]
MNFTVHPDAGPSGDVRSPVRILVLQGELDHGSAPHLQRALDEVYAAECRHVVFDVTRLAFCDSTGVSVFLDARRAMAERGGSVALAGLSHRVERVFRLTGLAQAFATYATADEARAAIPAS